MVRITAAAFLLAACAVPSCLRQDPTQAAIQRWMAAAPECEVGALLIDLRRSSVLVDLRANWPFEPASTIKALHLLLALQAIEGGSVSMDTPVTTHLGPTATTSPPLTEPPVSETLRAALRSMMLDSDHHRTRTITDRLGGFPTLNRLAQSIGMRFTLVQHHINGEGPPNRTTLHDLARLFQRLFAGVEADSTEPFQGCISTQYRDGGYADGRLWGTIYNHAEELGLSTQERDSFCQLFVIASTTGGYRTGNKDHVSWAAHVRIPYRWTPQVSFRYCFAAGYVSGPSTANIVYFTALRVATELLSDQLKAALTTFKNSEQR